MRRILALLLALAPLPVLAAPPSLPRAELWNSEQFVLHSAILKRDILVQVAKPFDKVTGKVPAVYITDGNMLFSAAAAVAAANSGNESTGPAYYIGISYAHQDRAKWFTDRSADLTFEDMKAKIATGQGERFAAFVMRELQPAIEKRYPVDPKRRVLVGYSFGGLFGTNMLFKHPEAFDTYLLCSPSIWAQPKLLETARTFDTSTSPKRVFIAIGGDEKPFMLARELYEALDRAGNGLTLQYWSIPDENHMTVPPAFLSRALRFGVPPIAKPEPAAAPKK